MQRGARPEGLDLSSIPSQGISHGRSASISSDRPSLAASSILSPPLAVSPEPLYIAPAAASHLVSTELDTDGATVSAGALGLANNFLDQILFSILSRSRSTQLISLRPATLEVLKHRLGSEAVAGADDELKEYLGDGEDEELESFHGGHEPKGDFDLELAWKLSRLRCMVYTRLGDLEEDDEDRFIEKEGLDDFARSTRRYSNPSSITPAAAIFLTSVLEYLGEQALYYAGQAAQRRLVAGPRDSIYGPASFADKTVVEEVDMFAVGRDSPLSRLWRTWRRSVRSPGGSLSHTVSRESLIRRTLPSSRKESLTLAVDEEEPPLEEEHGSAEMMDIDPSQIPLPLSENDVNEIEVPGLARVIDDEEEEQLVEVPDKRPHSMFIIPSAMVPPSPDSPTVRIDFEQRLGRDRLMTSHTRSRSLPTPAQSPFRSPTSETHDEADFVTPLETVNPLEVQEGDESEGDESEGEDGSETPTQETASTLTVAGAPATVESGDDLSHASKAAAIAAATAPAAATSTTLAGDSGYAQSEEADAQRNGSVTADFLDIDDSESLPNAADAADTMDQVEASGLISEDDGRYSDPASQAESDSEDQVLDPEDSALEMGAGTDDVGTVYGAAVTTAERQSQAQPARATVVTIPPTSKFQRDANSSRLTPLQEITENVRDAPEDPPSVSPVENGLQHRTAHSQTVSQASGHSRGSGSTSSNYSWKTTRGSIGVVSSQSYPGMDRGASYGVPPSGSAPAMNSARGRRSDSLNDRRPGTSSSQKSVKPQLVSSSGSTRSRSSPTEGKRSLDDLIQGDETLHYTLTPQNMQEMEAPGSPRWKRKTGTAELADFLKNTAPPGDTRPITGRSAGSSSGRNVGSRAQPPETSSTASTAKTGPSHTEIPPVSPVKMRLRHVEPRDAKVQGASTRDLADFAKSTGPENASQLPSSLQKRTVNTTLHSPSASSLNSSTSPIARTQSPVQTTRQSPASRRPGPRLQARAATVNRDEQTSQLIDFIRQGPSRGAGGGQRINQAIAPFLSMDSDNAPPPINSADSHDVPGRASMASTHADSFMANSTAPPSVSSRTALLETSTRSNARLANGLHTPPAERSFGAKDDADDGMMPKKKRSRPGVRDPYSLDSDDDDVMLAQPAPKPKPKRAEENMLDFLRNTSPPPESEFKPQPLMVSEAQIAQAKKNIARAASTPSFLKGTTNNSKFTPIAPELQSPRKHSAPGLVSGAPAPREQPNGLSREGSTLLKASESTQSNKPRQPSAATISSAYSSTPSSTRRSPIAPKVAPPINPPQARGGLVPAKRGVGGTADLADFLRNSGPPEPTVRPSRADTPPAIIEDGKGGGLRGLFGRRKRAYA